MCDLNVYIFAMYSALLFTKSCHSTICMSTAESGTSVLSRYYSLRHDYNKKKTWTDQSLHAKNKSRLSVKFLHSTIHDEN